MTEKILRMKIKLRRDTTANWELYKDIIPAAGEPCFDLDLGTLKIGDGIKTYEQLGVIGGTGGVSVSADGESIVLSDSVFKLAGFDTAETGAQPRKKSDGTLEWIVPSTDTVEGVQMTIAALQSDVSTLQTDVNDIQEILTPSAGESLLSRLEAMENKMDGTGEGSVDAKITDKINEFATNITDDGVVNSYQELITYVANHSGEAATMAADIAALQELVGEESVADQIASAISGVEGGGGGQINKIESIKLGGSLLDIVEKSVNIPIATTDSIGVVKGSNEITVADDGSLEIGQVSVSKLVQESNVILILDGGAAV